MLAAGHLWRHGLRSSALLVTVGACLAGSSAGAARGESQRHAAVRGVLRIAAQAHAGPQVTAAAGGGFAGYALLSDGSVWAWGDDLEGQIGPGGAWYESVSPVRVPGLARVVAIAGGANDAYALDRAGEVWAWGDNGSDELGDDGTADRQRPVRIAVPSRIVALAAGMFDGYALRRDGTVWAWGGDGEGQLGATGAQATRTAPRRVQRLAGVVAIAADAGDGYALRRNGTVWAWGAGAEGQLGRGCDGALPLAGDRASRCLAAVIPVRVRGLDHVVAIAAGAFTTYALRRDGTVWAWGDNHFGELGGGAHKAVRGVATRVRGLSHVVAIAAAAYAAYALLGDGTVWAWGWGAEGELGDGTNSSAATPTRVVGVRHVVKIQAGGVAAYALDASGRLWAWGGDDYGQLGDGHLQSLSEPTRVLAMGGAAGAARSRPGTPLVDCSENGCS